MTSTNAQAKKPKPTDFGLDETFDFEALQVEQDKHDKLDKKFMNVWLVLGLGLGLFIWIKYNNTSSWNAGIAFLSFFYVLCPVFLFSTIVASALLNPALSRLSKKTPSEFSNIDKKRADKYLRSLNEWNYWNLETGDGWWKTKRGKDFEKSLYKLFDKRGGKVWLTQSSNDGGVDLILSFGDEEYWIQAKGLAQKVGVAPIREIAGVCSRGRAVPVLAAVNGYTQSALKTARDLDVKLLGSYQLARMAGVSNLNNISFLSNN